jgi:hypothetical protein
MKSTRNGWEGYVLCRGEKKDIKFSRKVLTKEHSGDLGIDVNILLNHHHHHWKTALFEAQPSLEDSARFAIGFSLLCISQQ